MFRGRIAPTTPRRRVQVASSAFETLGLYFETPGLARIDDAVAAVRISRGRIATPRRRAAFGTARVDGGRTDGYRHLAPTTDSLPAAAAPRLVSAEFRKGTRGVAAARPRDISKASARALEDARLRTRASV